MANLKGQYIADELSNNINLLSIIEKRSLNSEIPFLLINTAKCLNLMAIFYSARIKNMRKLYPFVIWMDFHNMGKLEKGRIERDEYFQVC